MANYLASIYGTEQDKVNCSFYFKIGACRHGEKCSRKHIKPNYSQTIMCPNLYQNPALKQNSHHNGQSNSYESNSDVDSQQVFEDFEAFYEDIYCEAAKFGEVEEIVVCENANDHLNGNVYIRFKLEEDAQKACDDFNTRWYNGRPIYCELSPVTEIREACCRQHDIRECGRGGLCNFIHAKRPSRELLKDLELSQKKYLKMNHKYNSGDERSPSPDYRRRR
ncbi:splicing factor U2AF 35 kDa subunit [Nadsonia fulvescens var. elongata DSM 6958]|uniref:Splicing factor U2AF 35 kDa subunit n=1 Tax=Nadsonia fulvescens var. elongata DSM 6958 TaxID=857566 RepID=A0A1E3PSN7_9ASCO|nr:splicing factor U2AF 35 kDa subunit [Nadsonia fulvescens var. elongata DSM 6958]